MQTCFREVRIVSIFYDVRVKYTSGPQTFHAVSIGPWQPGACSSRLFRVWGMVRPLGSFVHTHSLHFCKRLFTGPEPVTKMQLVVPKLTSCAARCPNHPNQHEKSLARTRTHIHTSIECMSYGCYPRSNHDRRRKENSFALPHRYLLAD